jgi:gamma-glutamylputrescine oxidase
MACLDSVLENEVLMLRFAHQPPCLPTTRPVPATGGLSAAAGAQSADVCVVGGGLAGLSAALNLAERGFSVTLLEGATIGFGASGRNGGQVIAGYACGIDTMRAQLGSELARVMWDMSVEAVDIIDERVRKHGIDCDWTRGFAMPPSSRATCRSWKWQQEAEPNTAMAAWQLWDKATLAQQLGSERYVGGLFDPRSGHLHPLNYTLGLARAARPPGENLRAVPGVAAGAGRAARGACRTRAGALRARGAGLQCLYWPAAAATGAQDHAGRHLCDCHRAAGRERAASLIANNMAVCDTNFVLDYYRLSADHRLLFGGKVSYSGGAA